MTNTFRAVIFLAFCATPAVAGSTPSRMMANVYRFSEAASVLEICFQSEAFKALPAEKAQALQSQAKRFDRLVKAIGQHYADESLHPTYEATRARIAAGSELKLHVKNHYGYCDDRLLTAMDKYLAENELLIGRYLSQPAPAPAQRRPPEAGPPASR